jgi:hypothetical protein
VNMILNVPKVVINDAERFTGLKGVDAIKKVLRKGVESLAAEREGEA